jgi:flagellar basal-body rod modification protein FlgD
MSTSSVAAQNAALIAAKEQAAKNGTTTKPNKTTADASQDQLSSDLNFFLKMLTTQLQNQDPTSPLDTNEFTQQIAQYSSVQQQVNTNSNLEKLLAANKQSSLTTAVGYIGKEVETKGNTGEVSGGQGAFSYLLPKAAASVEIVIRNANGVEVFRGKGDTREGRNIAVWDGVNSLTGAQEPDGTYTISVDASDASKKPILAETRAVAVVGGVESDSKGDMLLAVGRNKVKFDEVLAVRPPSRISLSSDS